MTRSRADSAGGRPSRFLLSACHRSSDPRPRRNGNAGESLLHERARQRPGQGARLLHERPRLERRVENPTPDGPRFLTVGVKGDEFQLVLWPGTPGHAEPAMGRVFSPPGLFLVRGLRRYRPLRANGQPAATRSAPRGRKTPPPRHAVSFWSTVGELGSVRPVRTMVATRCRAMTELVSGWG
jgi:hypothetical protein